MPCYMFRPGLYLFTYFSLVYISFFLEHQEWEEYFCHYSLLALIALEWLIIRTKNIGNILNSSKGSIYILYGREEMAELKRHELIWNTFTANSLLACFWKTNWNLVCVFFGLYILFREIRFYDFQASIVYVIAEVNLINFFSGIMTLLQEAAVYILGDWKSFPINCSWKNPINKLFNLNELFLNAITFHDPF